MMYLCSDSSLDYDVLMNVEVCKMATKYIDNIVYCFYLPVHNLFSPILTEHKHSGITQDISRTINSQKFNTDSLHSLIIGPVQNRKCKTVFILELSRCSEQGSDDLQHGPPSIPHILLQRRSAVF